jgi:hypothetical protein
MLYILQSRFTTQNMDGSEDAAANGGGKEGYQTVPDTDLDGPPVATLSV